MEETQTANTKISDLLDDRLDKLKAAANNGHIVKGIKETLKMLVEKKVEEVFLCDNDISDKYSKTLKEYCSNYLGKEPIEIKDFLILRDIVMNKKFKGKGPKCYCAAIIKSL